MQGLCCVLIEPPVINARFRRKVDKGQVTHDACPDLGCVMYLRQRFFFFFGVQEAVYGPDHDEPTEQGAVRKTAAKRKAPEPDPAAEAALAAINYKACAGSPIGDLCNNFHRLQAM